MALYIKSWSLADWEELVKWAKVGANNAMIGEFTEVEEIPPHGDLIERKAIYLTNFEIVMCSGNYKDGMKMLLEKIESAPTIIPAEGDET